MPLALFVSPHLDDVAFSCSGLLATLARSGWQCVVATVFTASARSPQGFALACQTDKGVPPHVDYMSLRRSEDAAYVGSMNRAINPPSRIVPLWLPLLEAPNRGYSSAAELFGPQRDDDCAAADIADALRPVVGSLNPELVASPVGYGNHVDHRAVIDAMNGLGLGDLPRVFYRDTPYILKNPGAPAAIDLTALQRVSIDIADVEERCIEAIACYRTQLPFQFGGDAAMRSRMSAAFRSFGADRVAEVFYADPRAQEVLANSGI